MAFIIKMVMAVVTLTRCDFEIENTIADINFYKTQLVSKFQEYMNIEVGAVMFCFMVFFKSLNYRHENHLVFLVTSEILTIVILPIINLYRLKPDA